jgi:hypothetical protein
MGHILHVPKSYGDPITCSTKLWGSCRTGPMQWLRPLTNCWSSCDKMDFIWLLPRKASRQGDGLGHQVSYLLNEGIIEGHKVRFCDSVEWKALWRIRTVTVV